MLLRTAAASRFSHVLQNKIVTKSLVSRFYFFDKEPMRFSSAAWKRLSQRTHSLVAFLLLWGFRSLLIRTNRLERTKSFFGQAWLGVEHSYSARLPTLMNFPLCLPGWHIPQVIISGTAFAPFLSYWNTCFDTNIWKFCRLTADNFDWHSFAACCVSGLWRCWAKTSISVAFFPRCAGTLSTSF